MPGWIELACRCPAARFPAFERALEQAGAASITTADGDTEIFGEPGMPVDVTWNAFVVTALFEDDVDRNRLVRTVHALLGTETPVRFTALAEQEWAEAWKAHWQPQAFAGDLWVVPSWCDAPAGARHVLKLDPGRAFGTGTHETTALCIDWLACEAALPRARVVDYGCGSAILALAAMAFGAARVDAVDIDDDALVVARENVLLNDRAQDIAVGRPESLPAAAADVLVANILMEPLLALAARFHALLAPGGRIAVSGLLVGQVERVLEAYRGTFTMDAPSTRGDWALLSGTRR